MALPTEEQALQMSVEELGGFLVVHHKNDGHFNVHNVMCGIDNPPGQLADKPVDYAKRNAYKQALVEAYSWGFTEGLFTWDPNQITNNWWRVSRRGRLLNDPLDVLSLSARDILPKAFLHPIIAEKSAPIFRAGSYDSAVFDAFKQVEIAVREATGEKADSSKLMKAVFNVEKGVLNKLTEGAEREGLMFVFAGAMQLFRNASGHRNQNLTPQEAAHLLIHASYLMTLLESMVKLEDKPLAVMTPSCS